MLTFLKILSGWVGGGEEVSVKYCLLQFSKDFILRNLYSEGQWALSATETLHFFDWHLTPY